MQTGCPVGGVTTEPVVVIGAVVVTGAVVKDAELVIGALVVVIGDGLTP